MLSTFIRGKHRLHILVTFIRGKHRLHIFSTFTAGKYLLHMLAIARYAILTPLFVYFSYYIPFSITSNIPFIVFLLCSGWYWYPLHFRVSPSIHLPHFFLLSTLYPIFSRYHHDYTPFTRHYHPSSSLISPPSILLLHTLFYFLLFIIQYI